MSRALAITDDVQTVLLACLSDGVPVKDACRIAKVGRRTFYDWMRRGDAGEEPFAAFATAVQEAQANRRRELVELVHKHAATDPSTARYLAACAMRDEYGAEGRTSDALEEAYGEATEDEVVKLMSQDPRIIAAVQKRLLEAGDGPGNDAD